jgi:adenylylsulfate kinase-like enzyme
LQKKLKNRIKMEKKGLIITVSGYAASGKSRLTYLLKKFLRENGFEVEQELNADHPTEENFDKHMSKHFDEIMENLKETRKITLKEVQLAREPIKISEETYEDYSCGCGQPSCTFGCS